MEHDEKENNMNSGYGAIGASDAAVLALLADTSRAGRGGGYGGGGYGGEGYGGYGYGSAFANLSSNAVRTNSVHEAVNRNGEDAHFFALSNEDRSHFNILNQQNQANQLGTQAQISQLALQLCECCGDNKAALGRIEGKLDCLGKEIALDIALAAATQTKDDLLGQVAVLQNQANSNQSNDQHAQILQILGQIAGALAGMGNGNGHGGRR